MKQIITRKQLKDAEEILRDSVNLDTEVPLEVRGNYVGRGMRHECVGIVCANVGEVIEFMIAVAEVLSPDDLEDQKVIVSEMGYNLLSDGMGKYDMIYYFPGLTIGD